MREMNKNDMRNTIRYNAMVRDMREVAGKAAAFRAAKDSLERRGPLAGSRAKISELENRLDKVAPALELWQRERGVMGLITDAELVRRLEGPESVAMNAGKATALIAEVDEGLRKESLDADTNIYTRKSASRWGTVLKAAKAVAAVVAAAGACVAAYVQIRYGASMGSLYQMGLAVSGGALVASGILSRGQRSMEMPEAASKEPEVGRMRHALSEMRMHLNRLREYSPQASS